MLLDCNKNLKIADFGVARIEAINQSEMTSETGTYGYMAPEVLISLSSFLYIMQFNSIGWLHMKVLFVSNPI